MIIEVAKVVKLKEEISRLYREILYLKYELLSNNEWKLIHLNQKLRGFIDIYTQMNNGRDFDEEYLKDLIKW